MNKETAVSVFLSGELSPPGVKIVVTSYYDLDATFFAAKGYNLTVSALTGKAPRRSLEEHNSHHLIGLLAYMLNQGESCEVVHGVCCALNIPTYHLMKVIPDEATKKNLINTLTKRMQLSPKFVKHKGQWLYKEFYLLKRSLERNCWYRHHHELFCLCRAITLDLTKRVEGTHGQANDSVLYRRVERLIEEAFGPNYASLMGANIVFAAYTAYALVVAGVDVEEFDYTICQISGSGEGPWIPSTKLSDGPRVTLGPFLSGKHQPTGSAAVLHLETPPDTSVKCAMFTLPSSEATLHVNVQVSHIKVLSKERMLHGVSGKCLAWTVIKKKTMACSSYRAVEPDWCVPTSNSLNFNLHGYDLSTMNALVALSKLRAICSADELVPIVITHTRSSSHSFQNGVLNPNTYRQKVLERYGDMCFKVPHFPAVSMLNLGLLHRETVLMNLQDDKSVTINSVSVIRKVIRAVAEIDERLYTLLYEFESAIQECSDNHVLGIFKVAYLFGREAAARSIPQSLLFDRLLVGLTPKTCKSEFADKSKFDCESKRKASKKIKLVDRSRDRKSFLERVSCEFPDAFIDQSNANSRGKWSFMDRINHSPDWIFYSDFMECMLGWIESKYKPAERFSSLHSMIDMMVKERAGGPLKLR